MNGPGATAMLRPALLLLLLLLLALPGTGAAGATGAARGAGAEKPAAPGELSHSPWDALLKHYVNAQARVDYRGWKQNGLKDLDAYLRRLAQPWPADLAPEPTKAALINAYNALTVRWVLENYPAGSIWQTPHPFTEPRHVAGGRKVSLDDIESRLRGMGDPRVHAALVCAARSCPPLRREAYTPDRLDSQLDDNMRVWLANGDLNEFVPPDKAARVSMIFKWYRQDFEHSGVSLPQFLARYAPADKAAFLRLSDANIAFKTYHWGLNDASSLGSDYSWWRFLWDYYRNRF